VLPSGPFAMTPGQMLEQLAHVGERRQRYQAGDPSGRGNGRDQFGPAKRTLLTQLNTPKIGGTCRYCDSGTE
jgi:hypothetical protein